MTMPESIRWLLANAELDRLLEQSADARAAHLASLRARDQALAADVEALSRSITPWTLPACWGRRPLAG